MKNILLLLFWVGAIGNILAQKVEISLYIIPSKFNQKKIINFDKQRVCKFVEPPSVHVVASPWTSFSQLRDGTFEKYKAKTETTYILTSSGSLQVESNTITYVEDRQIASTYSVYIDGNDIIIKSSNQKNGGIYSTQEYKYGYTIPHNYYANGRTYQSNESSKQYFKYEYDDKSNWIKITYPEGDIFCTRKYDKKCRWIEMKYDNVIIKRRFL